MDNNGICARKINWLKRSVPAFILTGITFLVVFLCFDVIYDINDDVMIESMLSGSYLEQYPFTYYLSAELGIVISMLYTLAPKLAWLGIVFAGFYIMSFFLMANKLYERLMDKKLYIRILAFIMLEAVFICMLLGNFILIHYTVVAAVLGGAGLFLFALSKKPSEFVAPIVLFLLCYMVRVNVFYMLLPFVGLVFLYLLFNNKEKNIKSYLISAAVFFAAFIIIAVFNSVIPGKMSKEWKAYVEYNDLRTSVYDYTGIPDYADASGYYSEKAGMSQADVELYKSYDIAFRTRDKSILELQLIEHLYEQKNQNQSVASMIKWCTYSYLYRMIKENTDRPYNVIAIILYVSAIVMFFIKKQYLNSLFVVLTGVYRSALWVYLIYQGRYPERVTLSIYVMEILLLLSVIFGNLLESAKSDKKDAVILVVAALIFMVPGIFGINSLSQKYQAKINTNSTDDVVYSYMGAHPENIYLIDVYATIGRTKKALEKTVDYENYLLLGGWQVEHPLYLEKLSSFGSNSLLEAFKSNDNMYLVIREDEGSDKDMLSIFTGCSLQVVDYIPSADTGFYILGKIDNGNER